MIKISVHDMPREAWEALLVPAENAGEGNVTVWKSIDTPTVDITFFREWTKRGEEVSEVERLVGRVDAVLQAVATVSVEVEDAEQGAASVLVAQALGMLDSARTLLRTQANIESVTELPSPEA